MRANYTPFVVRMIHKYEGGYCWDKGDPGGPTKYGITCYDYAEFLGEKMTSMAAWAPRVEAMRLDEAETIYAKKYAAAIGFDALPAGVDCTMMDYGVNSGVGRPIRVARAILGAGSGTRMTPALTEAIGKYDAVKFIDAMNKERLEFMHRIRNGTAWATFGKGWGARVADLDGYSKHLAMSPSAAQPEAPDLSNVPTPKARNVQPGSVSKAVVHSTAAGTGSGVIAHAAVPTWEVAVATGVLVAVGGIAYAMYQRRKHKLADAAVHLPVAP